MIWNPFGRNLSRDDFSHLILGLLISSENGGIIRLDQNGSEIWFSFARASGTDTTAILALRIPRGEWSNTVAEDLRQTYEAHGFEYLEEPDNKSLLAQVLIPVDDIWEKACGARGAHAARLLLDTIGSPRSARFRSSDFRKASRGWKNHKEKLERLS